MRNPGFKTSAVAVMMLASLTATPVSAQKLPGTTTVTGTTITAVSPDTRLSLQLLPMRGDPILVDGATRYSCATLGGNYVLVGLQVRHQVTTLVGINLFCAPLRADGTLGTSMFFPATAPAGGTVQEVKCPSGQAVAGYQGTIDNSAKLRHLRSITLFCAKLNGNGLLEGTPTKVTPLGISSGIAFGPDMCSGGRAAREMRLRAVHIMGHPTTVGAWQLGCVQPTR